MESSVSQAIEDDDFGSFIIIQRFSDERNDVNVGVQEGQGEERRDRDADTTVVDQTLENVPNPVPNESDGEGDGEHFIDASADLESSPEPLTLTESGEGLGQEERERVRPSAEVPGTSSAKDKLESLSEAFLTNEDENYSISMTNYSTSSSTSEHQLEEAEKKLNQVVAEYKSLKDYMELQNLELEKRKMAIEELKLMARESIAKEKEKSEEFKKRMEELTVEKDLAILQNKEMEAALRHGSAPSANGFEALESFERQLQQRDIIIQQNGEQIKELSTRLHQEILQNEQLAELLRTKEEQDRIKNDSLSSSDEALAKSLSERERMEQILEEASKAKGELEKEMSDLKERLVNAQREKDDLIVLGQKLDKTCATLDQDNREMRIKIAAIEAEKERQAELFNEINSQNSTLLEEKAQLQQDLTRMNEMLQAKNSEIQNLQKQTMGDAAAPAPMSGSLVGNFLGGLLKKSPSTTQSFGIRDENDDPTEPYQETFEHVGASGAGNQGEQQGPRANQCPICLKRFDHLRKLEFHASNCGVETATRSDPFIFP